MYRFKKRYCSETVTDMLKEMKQTEEIILGTRDETNAMIYANM